MARKSQPNQAVERVIAPGIGQLPQREAVEPFARFVQGESNNEYGHTDGFRQAFTNTGFRHRSTILNRKTAKR